MLAQVVKPFGIIGTMTLSKEEIVGLSIETANEALLAGEMPIGALVLYGDEVIARSYTREQALGRRIVHADLLAMQMADEVLGFQQRERPLTLAVNLEPCMMCLGAAMNLQVDRIYYGLGSPNDGGVELLQHWHPPVMQPFYKPPLVIEGAIREDEVRRQFKQYADGVGPAGMREWARGLADSSSV